MEKMCRGCSTTKPTLDFYKHSRMADGFLNFCKECVKNRVKTHRQENVESIRAYDRERGRSEKRLARVRENCRKARATGEATKYYTAYAINHPERVKAVQIANRAVRDGKLKKQPCEICGEVKAQKHHPDYSKPLEVVWLCQKHHKEIHRKYEDSPQEVAA